MTTCQRKHHIEAINAFLENNGFELDRWGKYRKGNVRIDSTSTNLKINRGDFKVFSKPMVNITMENLETLIQKLFK